MTGSDIYWNSGVVYDSLPVTAGSVWGAARVVLAGIGCFANRRVPAMEMHQIRYFLAVADELNFTRAAERCNVAQPSLTRAIKLLEDEFGGPLFHRERANTHLSELGRMVRPHLEQIAEDSLEAKRLAQEFAKLRKTKLKLGVMCTIAPNQLVELLGSLPSPALSF
jgi:Bacterial regulatory helix-turn-helix protein, lysR family